MKNEKKKEKEIHSAQRPDAKDHKQNLLKKKFVFFFLFSFGPANDNGPAM